MSRQLRNLLKQNRLLEEKIFYEPRKIDWRTQTIDTQELSEALSCLAPRIIENKSNELSLLKMLNDIDKIKGRPLPAYEKNALQVVEIIFDYLRANTFFDQRYYHVLNSLQLAFTRLSLNDLSFLDNPKHVAVKLLDKLIHLGYHFDHNAGKLTQYFVHAIELLIDRLANRERVTSQTFIMADKMLDEYFSGFNDKTAENTSLIMAQVEKDSRHEQANQFTVQLIKGKTQGEEMPIFLLDFFDNHIASVLHQIISQHGVNSKQCQQLLTDMDTISWSITCAYGDTSYLQRFEADVNDAMKRLYQQLLNDGEVSDYVREFFVETEQIHSKKLRGERVSYDVMISADIFSDEEYENDDNVSWYENPEQKFFNIDSLEQEKWYYLLIDDKKVRCKLLIVNKFSREFLFVNLSGELTAKINFDETEYLSNNISPVTIDEEIEYKHASRALVDELKIRLSILTNEYQLFLKQRAKDKQQQEQQEEEAREAVQHQIEREKRQLILQRQAELRREMERQAETRRMEELSAKQRFLIKGVYRKLKPGVVVAYQAESGKWSEASLMLISKTTQRHIFTDNKGDKLIEPTKQELLDLIAEQRIRVVRAAETQVDPLSSLVRERRHKLSGL